MAGLAVKTLRPAGEGRAVKRDTFIARVSVYLYVNVFRIVASHVSYALLPLLDSSLTSIQFSSINTKWIFCRSPAKV